jgi:hypothetical protein
MSPSKDRPRSHRKSLLASSYKPRCANSSAWTNFLIQINVFCPSGSFVDFTRLFDSIIARECKRRSNPFHGLTQDRLLRGGCHRAALRAAPLSGNDSGSNRACLIVCTVISLTVGPFVTARTPSSAKEPAMTNDHMRNLHRDAWRGELTED